MIPRPPSDTRTCTLVPYLQLFRSVPSSGLSAPMAVECKAIWERRGSGPVPARNPDAGPRLRPHNPGRADEAAPYDTTSNGKDREEQRDRSLSVDHGQRL